ncbi:DUF2339 domain-containing protein [Roseomonas sp. OT10]|uniref:DUF2339 domain-containing protein n=1 Tax=Roseomonas cutis TaxID=2897332 RepID=UPI001E4B24CE|nr:DUF2339 domain-containing protein [Roseomonas sp. OT10]UFN50870.1 DUF2339 domain-containing protein [Roseomonas sp. OT10]
MDEFVLLGLMVAGGWLLGVLGFFRAGRARREIMALRREVEALRARPAASPSLAATVPSRSSGAPPARPWRPWDPLPEAAPALPEAEPAMPRAETAPAAPDGAMAGRPADAAPPPTRPRRPGLEEALTLRWGVWLGAAALLLAAIFLVRTALEEGWLGPAERCALAALLGLLLIGGAEALRRRPARAGSLPDYAPGALAAGGVAALFAGAYAATGLYDLLGPVAGFAAMAAAAFAGLALALRFGPVVGAIGLAGAFATPMLVQTEDPSLPALFAYLLAVTAAAMAVVRFTGWAWLGWAATVAGAGWAAIGLWSGAAAPESWAPALFVPAAAALHLGLLPGAALDHPVGRRLSWVPFLALGAAALLPAVTLPADGASLPPAVAVLLLLPVALWRGVAEPRLDRLPWLAAALGLLLLLGWALPEWNLKDEVVTAEAAVLTVLSSPVLPEALLPYLAMAGGLAGLCLLAGLWREGRPGPHPLHWAALAAAVPVLTLLVAYLRIRGFAVDARWALAAVGLAGLSTGAATRSARAGRGLAAGAHAAGAVAALSLGLAMLLREHWLSLAVSLLLPALAWIEGRSGLRALRGVMLAVAAVVLVRLLLNPAIVDYAFGATPGLNALLAAYGLPALAFVVAARELRARGDDLAVAVLEAGALALGTALVLLELRHAVTGGVLAGPEPGFAETALYTSALAVLSGLTLWLARWRDRPVLRWAWRLQGAAAMLLLAGLLLGNPSFTGESVGATPLLNALLPAYLLPALLAAVALRLPETAGPSWLRPVLAGLGGLGALAWVTLAIRHAFHGDALGLDDSPILPAELWAWTGAWVVLGAAALLAGLRQGAPALRLAGLGLLAVTVVKVFLWDMAELGGLWRVLSFLGLGLALIGLGAVYRRALPRAEAEAPPAA